MLFEQLGDHDKLVVDGLARLPYLQAARGEFEQGSAFDFIDVGTGQNSPKEFNIGR